MKKLILLSALCLMLTACGSKTTTATDATTAPTQTTAATTQATEPETTASVQPSLWIYTPSDDLEGFVQTEILVDEISGSVITEHLILAGVLIEDTAVNSLELVESELKVDFNTSFRDLIQSQGSTGERAVMGSVVNTFLTAYGAETMTITVDGEVLESGHVVYDAPLSFYE